MIDTRPATNSILDNITFFPFIIFDIVLHAIYTSKGIVALL
jgi:hypothetical protein